MINWRDDSGQLTRKPYSILEEVEDRRDHREVVEEVRTDKQTVLDREFLTTFNALILTLYMLYVISVKCCIL